MLSHLNTGVLLIIVQLQSFKRVYLSVNTARDLSTRR